MLTCICELITLAVGCNTKHHYYKTKLNTRVICFHFLFRSANESILNGFIMIQVEVEQCPNRRSSPSATSTSVSVFGSSFAFIKFRFFSCVQRYVPLHYDTAARHIRRKNAFFSSNTQCQSRHDDAHTQRQTTVDPYSISTKRRTK